MAAQNPRKNVVLTPWQVRRIRELADQRHASESDIIRAMVAGWLRSIDTVETLLGQLHEEGFAAAIDALSGHPLVATVVVTRAGVTATLTDESLIVFPRNGAPEHRIEAALAP